MISSPLANAQVHVVSMVSTRSRSLRQMNCWLALRIMAPSRRCASQRIWKPLQMPSTGMPLLAASMTVSMTGLNREMAPQRR